MSIRVITTDRLLLRPFVLDDAQALFAYASAPAFSRHVNYDSPATLAETRAFLERVLLSESCDQMVWAMCLLNQTEVIGTLQITREATDTCTLHYDISHTLYGHGYTTEAVRAVLRWCLLHLPEITHFLADTMATNGGSRRPAT